MVKERTTECIKERKLKKVQHNWRNRVVIYTLPNLCRRRASNREIEKIRSSEPFATAPREVVSHGCAPDVVTREVTLAKISCACVCVRVCVKEEEEEEGVSAPLMLLYVSTILGSGQARDHQTM